MNEAELDIQRIAEDMILRLQRFSESHLEQAKISKWKAEGVKELHEAIRQEATRLATNGFADKLVGEQDAD